MQTWRQPHIDKWTEKTKKIDSNYQGKADLPFVWISQIDNKGVVSLRFSKDIVVVNDFRIIRNGTFTIQNRERPLLDVYVVEGVDSHRKDVEFDWQVLSMTSREMKIQLTFKTARRISQN